jgi:hypothetical protein
MRYHLPRCARCQVLVSSTGIVPSRRYSEIVFHPSASGLGGFTTTTISPLGSWCGSICPIKIPGFTSEVRVGPSLPDMVPGAGCGLSSLMEISGVGTGISTSSQMDNLNKSCVNMPRVGGSQLDLRRARASVASLSHRRIWWSSKLSNSFPSS